MNELEQIRANVSGHLSTVAWPETPEERQDAESQLLTEVSKLLAAVEAVENLAAGWEARGEHDMAFSKTLPDEDIAIAVLTEGASMVENARHIRNALAAALNAVEVREQLQHWVTGEHDK